MDKNKEIRFEMKGIDEEIKKLESLKDSLPDYQDRLKELRKEYERLSKELSL